MVAVALAFRLEADDVMATVGARVSMLMAGVAPAPPPEPAASVYVPAATVMPALPEARLAVGVKTAVLVVALVATMVLKAPLVRLTSALVNPTGGLRN